MITDAIKLSLMVALTSVIFISIIGISFGFVLARKRFPGKNALDAFLTLPMILPPTVTGYYIIILFGRNGLIGKTLYEITGFSFIFTWQGAVLASTIVSLPIMIKSSIAAFNDVDRDYEMISHALGKNAFQTFFRITLPLAKNGLTSGVILSFARAVGEFGATLMISGNIQGKTQTMPLAIYEAFVTGEDNLAMTLVAILTVMSLGIIYITNKLHKQN